MAVRKKLLYYWRFYRAVVVINLARQMQYRVDFLVGLVATAGWTIIALVFLAAIYGKVPTIAGWTYAEILAFLGFYRLLEGSGELIFYRSFKKFSEDIRRGRLDPLMTKPVDFQFYVSTRFVNLDSLSSALVGLAIFWYGLRSLGASPIPLTWVGFVALALCGWLIQYSLWVVAHSLNFWLVKVDNLRNLVHGIISTTRFPPEAYGRKAEIFLSFVIPLALIVAFPVKTLLNRAEWWYLPLSLLVSLTLLFLARRFFYFALRSYTSAGG